ncbi:family 1 glycosylhydrolase [Leifsonia aquatica]|uniref:family 1 glycosylhydrolase n=1 Tax=Leifsonia aquatica TaxID=144185 RepID=UPI00046837A7|nr:family 1 glycosylhydrolase [Leifsonia aquatica]
MTTHIAGFPHDRLHWLIGIEDTCVYPAPGSSMGPLNEFELTAHDTNWRSDIASAAALGATGLRYGVSWPLVHIAPGRFDWSVLDERIAYAVQEEGLTVIADLVHYGTPTWLDGSFADPGFPDALAEFAGAFAERYRGVVDHLTPLNEPLTTASFCGLRGVWPPALTGWDGWTTVTVGIARGVQRAIAAARAANPDVVIVHVEASTIYETGESALRDEVALLRSLATLPTDLVLGRVGDRHPLEAWVREHGAAPEHLAELHTGAAEIDLLGVNYYPDLTPRVLQIADGAVRQVTANRWSTGLRAVLTEWSARYDLPMLVTETSIEGSAEVRRDWLEAAAATVHDLHQEGMDVRGLTWWPLLDFVDWSYASGGRNVEEFVLDPETSTDATAETFAETGRGLTPFFRRMGLFELAEEPDGTLSRTATVAAGAFPRDAARISPAEGVQ